MMQVIYDISPYWETHKIMARLYELLECEGHPRVLCHNDTWFWNFLKDPTGKIQLIDWEYAGNNYAAADVADYTISLDYSYEGYLQLAEAYEGHPLSKKEVRYYVTCLALIAWYWFVWGLWKQATGTQVDDLKKWYDKAIQSLTKAMDLYKGAE